MSIKIYNTLNRKKEEFKPLQGEGKGLGIYVCGPTVYDDPHIGHARSAYVFDVIRRYLEYRGHKVTFVRNVTDVDDKIINKAKEEFKDEDIKIAVERVSKKYLDIYHKCMDDLGIMPPDEEPKATEYIDKMKGFIGILIQRGVAYESDGDVYFEVRKAEDYGKLSNQSLEMLESGARISPGENKKDPLDFALWKSAKEGEVSWPSPWGPGRPGWHIECSVMSSEILGDEFDIHGGGIDLIFPHHENELAQSEGAEKGFARYWIHNGLLTINKEKMAKSLGNFVTVDEVLGKYSPDVLKILFLGTHYSHPVDFSWDAMASEKESLGRIINFLERIEKREKREDDYSPGGAVFKKNPLERFKEELKEAYMGFEKAMDDDFNTSNAVAGIFDIVRYGNTVLGWSKYNNKEHIKYFKKAREVILKLGKVLGLEFKQKEKQLPISREEIEKKIDLRKDARKNKDFKMADKIRKDLDKIGIMLEDEKDRTSWRVK
ncbi:cysteine--tRNA ligase [Candidatus Omnitrophota bacterium]